MKILKHKFGSGLFVFLMSAMAGLSAHADDTEIFFGGAANAAVRPNILFILDTSGSMDAYDGETLHRMDRMKNAFYDLLSGMNNVNIGLMRFNDPGGPILYPITNIDEPIPDSSPYNGFTSARISSTDGDAEQDNATGVVTLDNRTLEITQRSSSGTAETITVSVQRSTDDAEEEDDGKINTESHSLEVPADDQNNRDLQLVGVIFRELGIPQNATILNAFLTFDIENRGDRNTIRRNDVDLRISGQLGNTIAEFSNSNNISSRLKTTNTAVWPIRGTVRAGREIESSDITNVIQELVQQATWSTDSDAALFLQHAYTSRPNGSRDFSSYDDGNEEPRLTVSYQVQSTPVSQTVGLRFSELDIPKGVTITSAKVEFTADRDSNIPTTLNIRGEAADNSAPLEASVNNLNRTLTTNTVNWTSTTNWQNGEIYDSADITDIVQEITDRAGWCGGNALTLLIDGTGTRPAVSYDASGGSAPRLVVEYDPTTIPEDGSCVSSALSYRINTASNDVEHVVGGGGAQYTTGKILTFGYDGSTKQAVGLRFNNLAVAANSTVSSAYLEFKASRSDSVASNFIIYAESSDNPGTYSDSRKANGLATIGTTVNWNGVEAWTEGQVYRTPDISPLIQAIVNRPGWNQGNAISLIIKTNTNGSSRDAVSFDESAFDAPRLVLRASGSTNDFVPTTRDAVREVISTFVPAGNTPIVDALYEAALYFRGNNVLYGKSRGDSGANSSTRKYFRVSHPGSYTGGSHSLPSGCNETNLNDSDCISEQITGTPVYTSPITDQCQTNHIVLLTDGDPTRNDSASLIRSMTGDSNCKSYGDSDYSCAEELSKYLFTNDQSGSVIGDQNIKTHTIGFNYSDDSGYLSSIATKGGGGTYAASSSSELLTVFKKIVGPALDLDTTFVSPGVTVNSFNRLSHRNEVYFSLFQPKENEYWPGNLKRYKLTSNGDILDSGGANAIDPTTGFFKDDAVSFWASIADGNDTQKGGAAHQLPTHSARKIYTHYSGASNLLGDNPISVANKTNITKDRLGIGAETDSYHENLINWIRGQDVLDTDEDGSTTDSRNQLADPLHSSPYLVTYGGTESDPDISVFYGDNEGVFHAVNASTGVEHFAFIPDELLPNLDKLYRNTGESNHPYGLDGQIAAWIKDVNANSIIETADNDHVYLYMGMRRGGRNYYALNVTNRNSPRMLWTINGGSGDFVKMGQTWARPIKTKINVGGTITDVLIISGGYDDDQDSANVRTADDIGNAMYIVNASTGALIWSASNQASYDLNLTDMQYSIPSTVRAIDVDADGVTDQFYVGDMGGQLWRFDVHNGNTVANLVTAGVIADLGGATAANTRRFYHEPDVSVLVKDNQRKLAIAIGSGFQAHPLNVATEDRFYLVLQNSLTSAPADTDSDGHPDYVKLTHSDLFDTTNNIIENGTDTQQEDSAESLSAAQGWFIDLFGEYKNTTGPGEKTLARALTLNGVLYFTTYQPDVIASASCTATDTAVRKLYSINLIDATPTVVGTDTADRWGSSTLMGSGIPSAPVHVRITDDDGTSDLVGVGTEFTKASSGDIVTKTFWYSF
ncbi:PilC/PilY family type IV pilus protein [Ketobacter sp.]